MAKITIVGAGITGLATASILRSKGHTVTVIARDLPPANGPIDLSSASKSWASPWAGAFYMPDIDASPAHQRMQRLALPHLLTLADAHPASSVRRIPIEDVRDDDAAATVEDVWYRTHVPDFEAIPASELPPGCTIGMRWGTVVLEPGILLPWLRARLEGDGVRFVEREVGSLKDVGEGVDVVINATGVGAKALAGDQAVKAVRGQTHLVRTWWEKVFMRQGSQYTYCIPRLDGTAILGGVKGYGSEDPGVKEDQRTDIFNRVGDNIPHVFAAFPADFDVIRDNVGFRPGREGGPRVEKEVIDGQKIVHAYGVSGSGYGYSFGLGEVVSELVDELLSAAPKAKL
ncbi:FAD dependent oxidoreductase [Macrophomina phaseolina]|uniref:FAD dependent oxidoreductase n=1 Tax=Macrophomina phaseolina TaxID=35725 RepID=A0ABQ8GRB6_9PEZI|nr:FAD dependent oxidoreductase [Macrophomina phaseolina]